MITSGMIVSVYHEGKWYDATVSRVLNENDFAVGIADEDFPDCVAGPFYTIRQLSNQGNDWKLKES